MYYLFSVINCLVILFLGYILFFAPDQLATGIGQRAILLTIVSLFGFIVLTGLSVYLKSIKQMAGLAALFLVLSWVLIITSFFIFLAKQKWM